MVLVDERGGAPEEDGGAVSEKEEVDGAAAGGAVCEVAEGDFELIVVTAVFLEVEAGWGEGCF